MLRSIYLETKYSWRLVWIWNLFVVLIFCIYSYWLCVENFSFITDFKSAFIAERNKKKYISLFLFHVSLFTASVLSPLLLFPFSSSQVYFGAGGRGIGRIQRRWSVCPLPFWCKRDSSMLALGRGSVGQSGFGSWGSTVSGQQTNAHMADVTLTWMLTCHVAADRKIRVSQNCLACWTCGLIVIFGFRSWNW